MPKFNQGKINKLKRIDGFLKSIYLFPKNKKEYPPLCKTEVKEIVIIAFLLIGDTVMYIPAIKILRRNFPEARLTLVCGNLVKTILEPQQLIDNFVIAKCPWIAPFDKSLINVFNFWSSIWRVNKNKYDVAIDFRGDWRNIFYMNFIDSARKISFDFSGGQYMLTDPISVSQNIDHLIDETLTLLKEVNCSFESDDKYPYLALTQDNYRYLESFIIDNNLKNKVIIGIHPGASLEERRWSEEKYGEVIVKLSKKIENICFILFEGPNEKQSIEKIMNSIAGNNINYLVINRTMSEYLVLLNSCNIIVCNDSGAAHLAAAFNIPEVVIFGKGDPKEVQPYARNVSIIVSHELECKPCHMINCKFGTNLCMSMVAVNEVYNHIVSLVLNFKKNQVKDDV